MVYQSKIQFILSSLKYDSFGPIWMSGGDSKANMDVWGWFPGQYGCLGVIPRTIRKRQCINSNMYIFFHVYILSNLLLNKFFKLPLHNFMFQIKLIKVTTREGFPDNGDNLLFQCQWSINQYLLITNFFNILGGGGGVHQGFSLTSLFVKIISEYQIILNNLKNN
jgi:hypothetical protein